jgi:hypothetical protein
VVVAGIVLLVAAGCQAAPANVPTQAPPSAATGVIDPDRINPARLAPLVGLGACPREIPAGTDATPPDDIPLPEEAVVTQVQPSGNLTSLQGWSPRTPVEIMVSYLRVEDWKVQQAEDEVFESEILLVKPGQRLYVKAQATCERGSAFVAFLGSDDAPVPVPSGGTGN